MTVLPWFGLISVVLWVYAPLRDAGFVWNDSDYVTRAGLRSWAGLARIWFEVGATEQYYPLLHSSFWLQHRIWGDEALGYHLVGVLQHACAAGLFATLLARWAVPGAWLAAFVFALHPICVESAAWVAEQKNTQSLVLFLAAALAHQRFQQTRSRRAYAAGLVFFVLALLSKTTTATLVPALWVVAWWRHGDLQWARDVRPLLPWFALGAVAGLFSAWVEKTYIGAEGEAFALSGLERIVLAGRIVWFYLGKLLWPADLAFIYPRWEIGGAGLAALVPAFLAGLALLALWGLRSRTRAPLAIALLFGGSLFPVLGFFNVYGFLYSYVADHWQYLPSLAVIAGFASALTLAMQRLPRVLRLGMPIVLLGLLGVLSWQRTAMYQDLETFYRALLRDNPGAWMAHNNLGTFLRENRRLEEAEVHFNETLRLRPRSAKAHNNLGVLHQDRRRHAQALPFFREAVRLEPERAIYHDNLATALRETGQAAEALTHHREALTRDPGWAVAQNNQGVTLRALGRLGDALESFQEAARLDPRSGPAQLNLALTYSLLGREAESRRHYEQARQLNPALPPLTM